MHRSGWHAWYRLYGGTSQHETRTLAALRGAVNDVVVASVRSVKGRTPSPRQHGLAVLGVLFAGPRGIGPGALRRPLSCWTGCRDRWLFELALHLHQDRLYLIVADGMESDMGLGVTIHKADSRKLKFVYVKNR